MTASATPPILSIGAVVDSDPESRACQREIAVLGKQVIAARGEVDGPLRVNVAFHVDSDFTPNEFAGVRSGRFSKTDFHLQVQAAVPRRAVTDRRAVILELLNAAVDEAEAFARSRGLADGLREIRAIVGSLPAA